MTEENHEKLVITKVYTNNILEAVKKRIESCNFKDKDNPSMIPICFFINSTTIIINLIEKLGIEEDCVVFCAEKSVVKLNNFGFYNAYEDWSEELVKKYMFFTSRFYSALDIELSVKPHLIFVSDPSSAESTLLDPATDIRQAMGRFRNGLSDTAHIAHINQYAFPNRSKDEIEEYLQAMEGAYDAIKTLYDNATTKASKEAFEAALNIMPFSKFIRNGKKDYFAIDNYIHRETVKSCYHSEVNLSDRYDIAGCFTTTFSDKYYYTYGEKERLSLQQKGKSKRAIRIEIVEILDKLSDEVDAAAKERQLIELQKIDSFIVDAFYTLGKEEIKKCQYYSKRIKEAIILKEARGTEVIELIKNSFVVGNRYSDKYIKEELNRIYSSFGITNDKGVTAQTLKDYFKIEEVKLKRQRAMLIVAPKI